MICINKNDLLFSRDAVSTKPFASLEQRIRVSASGTIGGNVVKLTILAIDANGNESPAATFDFESNNGHFSLDHAIDPIYMLIYHNAHKLCISLEAKALEINNFSVFEEAVSSNEENISFSNIVDVDGERKAVVKRLDGNEITVPLIPQKVLFFGNSILFGMGYYGMCATDPENDYYFHVTKEILRHNPNCEFYKARISPLEMTEDASDFDKAMFEDINPVTGKPTADTLTDDIDLVIVQGGDNINNPRKVEAFKNTCGRFVELIKEKCPKARIIWVYGWYNKELCVKPILEACEKWRVESVDVSALMIPENQAAKGQTYIKADGTTALAPDGWLSHPGNTGMYRIAVKLLKKIGL